MMGRDYKSSVGNMGHRNVFRRLAKDETGIALGLAVIMIVLIGVMGVGLLVFVRNDLQAVVEVNQGQKAFNAADAGVQAAKRELLSEACLESYDSSEAGASDEEDACADAPESDWSYAVVDGENAEAGKELDFDGKSIEVSIRYLKPADEDQTGLEGYTPEEEGEYPGYRKYFEVESAGNSENGTARRKVEAIFYTTDPGYPIAYYSQGTVQLSGGPCIERVSVFSLDSIDVDGGGSGCPGEGSNITGKDVAYGDWENTYNSTARPDNTTDAGFGAVNDVTVGEVDELGTRDFDSSDDSEPYQFVADTDEVDPGLTPITFPFDHEAQEGQADEDRLEFLKAEAKRQGNYHENVNITNSNWPADSDDRTVVYIEASAGGTVKWLINGGSDCPAADAHKGTLVVDGADLQINGNRKVFSGITIVRGGRFDKGGNSCWGGPVSADEGIEINGSASPVVSEDILNRPGFYGVNLWSWRECYSEACN